MRKFLSSLLVRLLVMLNRERTHATEKTEEPRPDEDRGIFCFFDGIEERRVDPLEIWERIWTHPEHDFSHLIQDVETIDPEKQPKEHFQAIKDFIAFVREVFVLEPFEAGGLTYQEVRTLVGEYLQFMDDLKKKHDPSPTGSAPTDSSHNSDSATPNESAST